MIACRRCRDGGAIPEIYVLLRLTPCPRILMVIGPHKAASPLTWRGQGPSMNSHSVTGQVELPRILRELQHPTNIVGPIGCAHAKRSMAANACGIEHSIIRRSGRGLTVDRMHWAECTRRG